MGNSRFRSFPLYVKNRKVAEVNGIAYDLESGDELQFGAEGVLGVSEGIPTVKIEADAVIPVQGMSVDLVTIMLSKQNVGIGIRVDGKLHKVDAHLTACNFSSQSRNGEAKGKFTFIGGAPDLV